MTNYLRAGQYTVDNGAGVGSAGIGAFRASLSIPAAITWTNQAAIASVPRSQDLTITWNAADPAREAVVIAGTSTRADLSVRASFICAELASAGRFTVPAAVLSSLPPSSPWDGMTSPTGMLLLGAGPISDARRFTAPGIDLGYIAYTTGAVSMVAFK